ncbi:DUF4132 domain-containing protein [Lysobacter korlensis]|uniref:DUF4132 domain-containing protein n=1 Tax=Lysobacter korlensis TaxID=553636 RepID=A0ABV6S039_9GAMM
MLKWIEKFIGGASVEIPEGLPETWTKELSTLLAEVDETRKGARSGLRRDMLSYVLHGEPWSVLGEVAQVSNLATRLRLISGGSGDRHGAPALYDAFDEVPTETMLRWAKLLVASAGASANGNLASWGFVFEGGIRWPEALLMHATGRHLNAWYGSPEASDKLSAFGVEQMLIADGLAPSALLVSAFATPISNYGPTQRLSMVTQLRGYADALERHHEVLRPLLLQPVAAQRVHVLGLLAEVEGRVLERYVDELVELAVSSSKLVRAAAEPLVMRCGMGSVEPLKRAALSGKPDQRLNALRLLHAIGRQLDDAAIRDLAEQTAAADKAPLVQALPNEWRGIAEIADSAPSFDYTVPRIDWTGGISPSLQQAIERAWPQINQAIEKSNKQWREYHERNLAEGRNYPLHQAAPFEDAHLRMLLQYLETDGQAAARKPRYEHRTNWQFAAPAIGTLAAHEAMTPVALLKILSFFDLLSVQNGTLTSVVPSSFNALHRKTGRPTLLELSEMLTEMGLDGRTQVMRSYCAGWGDVLAQDWSDEAVWPFFAHCMDRLIQLMNPTQTRDYSFDRQGIYRAIATLPTPPAEVVNALFDLALGSGKTDRLPAQKALDNLPGKEVRIISALADGKADVRTVAAQWLGRLRCEQAIPALEKAVSKEKQDVPKGAMLDTLELLGQPVEKYLDRTALEADAAKTLAKGLPKDLEWFPWAALPTVRWNDTGAPVPADVLRWMLVQAVKHKSPEPNAVLRKYCAMFAPRDREAFGQFVLEAWLVEDVRPISPDEAMSLAKSTATSTHSSMASYPKYYKDDPNFGKSVEELTAKFLPGFMRQPAGSAIGSKGLLAIAAACAAERAAAPVARYLKEYYGTRAAQGKALIAMLAWIEHPSATQLMLSVGSRFRTKSFQEEATRQAEALAERKGWTLAELADRTMPTAGFDETATLELSYGPRVFTAKLQPDLKVELYNPDGKKIASLPEPRQDDDAELAKDSKKAFSAAKKEIKSVVDLQTSRLYEALCTERDWPYEDWERYLNRHPVVRLLTQRLVWSLVEDDRITATFRPLDDGTLTDNDDNAVTPAAAARVRIAHDSNLPAADVELWQQHLLDYEVTPLFQQFGKGTYTLPADKKSATSVDDFEGHLIEAFALRGRALKLGYTRGAAEDGGWFMTYEKRFPTLGLLAVIEFTGNPLPEQNRTVALLKLSFVSTQDEQSRWNLSGLPLSQVPAVLLSECYNDMRLIAKDGAGFDPDWQKKSEY